MDCIAHPHADALVVSLADGNSMCALAASVTLHDAAHFRVGEFLYVEQCSLHVSPFYGQATLRQVQDLFALYLL